MAILRDDVGATPGGDATLLGDANHLLWQGLWVVMS